MLLYTKLSQLLYTQDFHLCHFIGTVTNGHRCLTTIPTHFCFCLLPFFLLLHLVFLLLSFYQHCDKTVKCLTTYLFFLIYCCILFGFFLGPPAVQKISTSSVVAYSYTYLRHSVHKYKCCFIRMIMT